MGMTPPPRLNNVKKTALFLYEGFPNVWTDWKQWNQLQLHLTTERRSSGLYNHHVKVVVFYYILFLAVQTICNNDRFFVYDKTVLGTCVNWTFDICSKNLILTLQNFQLQENSLRSILLPRKLSRCIKTELGEWSQFGHLTLIVKDA